MSTTAVLARQIRYQNKAFWRNPSAAFFTFALPVVFLVIFTSIFNDTATLPGGVEADISTYYVPATLTFAVFMACYSNVATGIVISRDQGVLKRVRGTPLPVSVYLLARVLHSVAIMLLLVVVTVAFGAVAYDVSVPTHTALPFVVTLAVSAATFCALGLAITAIVPDADAAPAILNAVALPILFISGTFLPTDDAPAWLRGLADVFPVRHFVEALFAGYGLDRKAPNGWLPGDLLIIAAWGVAGGLLAARFFKWESRR